MNSAGTILAVVGTEQSNRRTRAKAVQAAMDKRNVKVTELKGGARKTVLKEFLSGKGWYRSGEVDQLSEKEADIISERLVRRVGAQVTLSGEKAKALKAALSQQFRRGFIRKPGETDRPTQEQWREALLNAAREHLGERGIEALKEALAKGTRAGPDEK